MDFTSSIFNSQFLILITDENLPLDMVLVVNIHASHLGFFGNTDSGFEADIQFCKWTPKWCQYSGQYCCNKEEALSDRKSDRLLMF